MPTPSLLIVPSRWKTGNPGKLYSQIPTNGNGDFNVTGVVTGAGNIGTRVNNLGYIESITTSGTPRLDYYTSSGLPGCPALLVEPSGTNLAVQSEDFTLSANWNTSTFGRTLVTGDVTATLDPYGGNVADLLSDDNTASNTHRMYTAGNISITSGTTYSTSFFVKANTTPWFEIRLMQSNEGDAGIVGTVFNLTSGTITSGSGTIQNYGNGWYRCTNIGTSNFTGNGRIFFYVYNSSGTKSYNGTSSNSLYIFGAQLETGSVATSYIPTTTAAVTRNADVVSVSGAVSGSIGQTQGTIYCEFVNTLVASYTESYVYRVFADANNEIWARKEGGGNTYSFRWRANSQNTTFLNVAVPNGVSKIAFGYKSGDTALFLNGSQVATTNTDVRAFSVNPTTIALGSTSSGQFFNDRIRAVALYTTRLTNADLMLLTLPGNNTYLPQAVWNNYLSRPGSTELPDCLYTRHADLLDV